MTDYANWPPPDPANTADVSQAIDTSDAVSLPTRRALLTLRAELGELLSDVDRALPITRPARLEDHRDGKLRIWLDDPKFISVHTLSADGDYPPCAYLRMGEQGWSVHPDDWKALTPDNARRLAYALLAAAKDVERQEVLNDG